MKQIKHTTQALTAAVAFAMFSACSQETLPKTTVDATLGATVGTNNKTQGDTSTAQTFKLENGQEIQLLPKSDGKVLKSLGLDCRVNPNSSKCSDLKAKQAFPISTDLRAMQSPLRNQGGRGTCVAFAVNAGLEAAYKRQYALDLDLSEQYLHHASKLERIDLNRTLPSAENALSTDGGSWSLLQMYMLKRGYGVPSETVQPYISSAYFEQPQYWRNSVFNFNGSQFDQDAFTLSNQPVTLNFPNNETITVNNLSQTALETAKYRAVNYDSASTNQMRSLTWFKAALAAGREVMVGLTLKVDFDANGRLIDSQPNDGIWQPGMQAVGGHEMLLVGYDDRERSLLFKNSWGKNTEGQAFPTMADQDGDGFVKLSYDWITQGLVVEASSITEVGSLNNTWDGDTNPQLFLGRWKVELENTLGTLDIYNLPKSKNSGWYRLGTYFTNTGAYRVNGTVNNSKLEFWLDRDNPNQDGYSIKGQRFVAHLFAKNSNEMAGSSFDEGDAQHHPFRAYKNNTDFYGGVAASQTLEAGSYLGHWFMDRNGQRGWLNISSVNATSGAVLGSFVALNGESSVAVTGVIGRDHRWIELNFAGTQRLLGLMHAHRHAISGMGSSDGANYGFWAVRSQVAFGTLTPGDAGTEAPVAPPVCQVVSSFPMCE